MSHPCATAAAWVRAVWLRHQMGAIAASLVDFGTMITCVRELGATPTLATALGASAGALSNFVLGRHWIFGARHETAPRQALRYALVAAVSLGLNVLGEWMLYENAGVPYVRARALVAISVGVLWNYPMHERFVFVHEP